MICQLPELQSQKVLLIRSKTIPARLPALHTQSTELRCDSAGVQRYDEVFASVDTLI